MTTLDSLRLPVAPSLHDVVRVFDDELRSDQPFVADLCRRAAGYRGKMLRPTLLLLTAEACRGVRREHIVLAAVVEMVHVATLVHDDVLDEAEIRRHGPTINRVNGNESAVLLGDYLISHAYHLCSSMGSTEASRRIAAATNRVCEGELMQVHHRGDWTMSEITYLEVIRRKTGGLTRVCCELGASGADDEIVRGLAQFGEDVGVAFQIMDDLLDITAPDAQTGKSSGRDAEMRKPTLPVIHFLANGSERQRHELIDLLTGSGDSRAEALRRLLAASGSVEYAMSVARRFIGSAVDRLSVLPASDARSSLQAAAEFVLARRN